MPLSPKSEAVLESMRETYQDPEKAKRVFYATANAQKRVPETWRKKEAASLGHMTLPTPSGSGAFHITGPTGADPHFMASQVHAVASQHANLAKQLVAQGVLHPNDVDQWHANSLAPVLGHLGIGAHPVTAGEPSVAGSHYKALPASVQPTATPGTGAFGKVAEGLAPCMGPWTLISTDGSPVTVEHKFEYGDGNMGFIGVDDGCYQVWVNDGSNRYSPTTHIFPEAHAALASLPDQCGMIAPMDDEAPCAGIPQSDILAVGAKTDEHIPGGPGEGVPDSAVPQKELAKGTAIEAVEHTDAKTPEDLEVGKEIAKDHLVGKPEEAKEEYGDEEPKDKKPAIAPMKKDDEKAEKAAALLRPYR